jgi:hypothetical protein
MEKELAAGRPSVALKLAQQLATAHIGTPEAGKAIEQIPSLQAAVKAAEEQEKARVAEAAAKEEARTLAAKWTYRSSEDPMTSRPARSAIIESENTVSFGFPYEGAQRGRLVLRDHPTYGRDVILSIERGQFLCQSYQDCSIRVRFDEQPAQRWAAVGPADNSTTSIFLRDEARFLERLRRAKIVRIQAPVYQEGEPVFEFNVGGFSYERYQAGA